MLLVLYVQSEKFRIIADAGLTHANALLKLRAANGGALPCTVEIRKEGPQGEVLGTCEIGNTGGADRFEVFDLPIRNTAGSHGLCFVFRTEAGEALRFDDFSIT